MASANSGGQPQLAYIRLPDSTSLNAFLIKYSVTEIKKAISQLSHVTKNRSDVLFPDVVGSFVSLGS